VTVGAIGVPLPVRSVKVSAQRFPCENSPCGCADAASCWRDCCCNTPQQKLAWAKKHGVTPPDFVIAAAREAESVHSCCASSRPACCHDAAKPAGSCCSTPAQPPRSKSVLLVAALKCRGISVSVSLLPPTVLPRPVRLAAPPLATSDAPPSSPNLYQSPTDEVATPPPDAV